MPETLPRPWPHAKRKTPATPRQQQRIPLFSCLPPLRPHEGFPMIPKKRPRQKRLAARGAQTPRQTNDARVTPFPVCPGHAVRTRGLYHARRAAKPQGKTGGRGGNYDIFPRPSTTKRPSAPDTLYCPITCTVVISFNGGSEFRLFMTTGRAARKRPGAPELRETTVLHKRRFPRALRER